MVSKQLAALTKRGAVLDAEFAPFMNIKEKKKDLKQHKTPKKTPKQKTTPSIQTPVTKKQPVPTRFVLYLNTSLCLIVSCLESRRSIQ